MRKGETMSLAEFGQAARSMSRNPLGIIALFITLIYGMASMVFVQPGFSADERMPFIWFLVLFPLVVLVVFAWLVASHHTKLYAPSDFRDESNFVSLQSPEAQRRRLEEEAEGSSAGDGPSPASTGESVGPGTEIELGEAGSKQAGSRARIFLAEELVLRKLEVEWRKPIHRQAVVGGVPVDGLALVDDEVRLIEVKSAETMSDAVERAKLAAEQARRALKRVRRESREAVFTVAIVVTGRVALPLALSAQATKQLEDLGFGRWVSFRFFSFDALAREFGVR